jgi:hypothetical protein
MMFKDMWIINNELFKKAIREMYKDKCAEKITIE